MRYVQLFCLLVQDHYRSLSLPPSWASEGNSTHHIAGLAVGLLLHGVEGLPAQLAAAGGADEAVHVEDLVHGGAAGALAHHVLPAGGAAAWGEGTESRSGPRYP